MMRIVAFWVLFGLGSLLLGVSAIGSQVPWPGFTFEKVASLSAALLLLGSLLLGRFNRPVGQWRAGSVLTGILSVELALCLYISLSLLTYQHK
jgi:hypothetical protein